jgi:aspartate racemase
MSWESSLEYYRIINETVKKLLGGFHSAKSIMFSFNFDKIQSLQQQGRWQELTELMINAAQKLETGGADVIIICTNTMHKVADEIVNKINIPLLHIADATAEKIIKKKIRTVGLLGTKFTMEEDFYTSRLANKYGLEVIIPETEAREVIHNIIFNELVLGELKPSSKDQLMKIINQLKTEGVEGIILGCTEIPLLINQDDVDIPIFDTTTIHATAAVEFILRG